jgi:hypothetical protein
MVRGSLKNLSMKKPSGVKIDLAEDLQKLCRVPLILKSSTIVTYPSSDRLCFRPERQTKLPEADFRF